MHAPTPTISTAMTAIARQIKAAQPTHKLVDETTGAEIALPARMKCWDGAEVEVCEFRPSKFKGNPGYIRTTAHEIYVPSVVGAKIVKAP